MIHHDLAFEDYARLDGWNWSKIKRMDDGPIQVKHAVDNPDDGDTTDRQTLRAQHCLVFEPENFDDSFVVYAGKSRQGKVYEAYKLANQGKTILLQSQKDKAQALADPVRAFTTVDPVTGEDIVLLDWLERGKSEVSLTWTCPRTGLPMKGRLDLLVLLDGGRRAVIVDMKNLGSTETWHVTKRVRSLKFHGQAAHYDDGVRANYPAVEVVDYMLLVCEGKGAQDMALFRLTEDGALAAGAALRDRLLDELKACVDSKTWPRRHTFIQTLVFDDWSDDDGDDEALESDPIFAPEGWRTTPEST